VRQETSYVARFLAATEDEYTDGAYQTVFVERDAASTVRLAELKEAFDTYMADNHPGVKAKLMAGDSALVDAGYIVEENVNVCKACRRRAEANCCSAYVNGNRTRCCLVTGLRIVKINADTSSKSERAFKAALEARLGVTFVKVRPPFLTYTKGAALELDMYDETRRLAVEYDGPQHYEFPNTYHRTRAEFEQQKARDAFKSAACEKNGVRLVRIRASTLPDELQQFPASLAAHIVALRPLVTPPC